MDELINNNSTASTSVLGITSNFYIIYMQTSNDTKIMYKSECKEDINEHKCKSLVIIYTYIYIHLENKYNKKFTNI